MDNTCIECNENAITMTELYCFRCYLDREVEAMLDYEVIDQLFVTGEAK
jgi:hypothetical protein